MILISYLSVPRRQHALYLPVPLPPTHARMLGGGFAAERFPSCSPPLACGAVPQEGGVLRVAPSPSPIPPSLPVRMGEVPEGRGVPRCSRRCAPAGAGWQRGGLRGAPILAVPTQHRARSFPLPQDSRCPILSQLCPTGRGHRHCPAPHPGLWEGAASARSGGNPLMASLLHPSVWGPSPRPQILGRALCLHYREGETEDNWSCSQDPFPLSPSCRAVHPSSTLPVLFLFSIPRLPLPGEGEKLEDGVLWGDAWGGFELPA